MMWLIAGANGQIGKTAVSFLQSQSIDFHSLGSKHLDISNVAQVKDIVESLNPSHILNAAAWTDVDRAEIERERSYVINATGPRNLANSARKVGARFIHVSSDYVFGGGMNSPISELTKTDPINYYGNTKAIGDENVSIEYPEGSLILRTSWVYSRYGKNFVKSILRKAITSEGDINVVDDQIGQPTFATDFVEKMYQLCRSDAPVGTYNITNSGSTSWYEFAREILRLCDIDPARVKPIKSDSIGSLAQRPKYSVLSDTKIRAVGLDPMEEWSDAIRRSISDIRQEVEEEMHV
jgi:dTDP-4-dehydrorhamnose reductase